MGINAEVFAERERARLTLNFRERVAAFWRSKTTIQGLLPDHEIYRLCVKPDGKNPLITGVRAKESRRDKLSWGLEPYGYTMRLADDIEIFRYRPGKVVDPKKFDKAFMEKPELLMDPYGGSYFILPANSFALGKSMERFCLPDDVTGFVTGKSTYVRSGCHAPLTPLEAGWSGTLTIEVANGSSSDMKVYIGEGICQVNFYRSYPCRKPYGIGGRYQNQPDKIVYSNEDCAIPNQSHFGLNNFFRNNH